ncbi:MAG: vitamin B12-dependent ribonucleotide reductase, partial [Gemmataceae bacterium]|nr:vitamin B12-dependent ribonucleotide reductase [Gemmataceae bacterium]
CGLNQSYGITGDSTAGWVWDPAAGKAVPAPDSYTRPSSSACFILSLRDDLVGPGGIMDLWHRESQVFKHGGGVGVNVSALRASGEPLSGGGGSSGPMSFLKTGDRNAGAIKSGGTTRRAALMRCMDDDHPDLLDFIWWKVKEENKVAALAAGSKAVRRHVRSVYDAAPGQPLADARKAALDDGVPANMLRRAELAARAGRPCPQIDLLDADWQGEAYLTVSGQNANNSVRLTDAFMRAAELGRDWRLVNRANRQTARTVNARDLWDQITDAAWQSADPGVQFPDTVNDWNPTPKLGKIESSNPCSEYMYLNDTACNLASPNLFRYLDRKTGQVDVYRLWKDARLVQTALDITVGMSQYPSARVAEMTYKTRSTGLGPANVPTAVTPTG